MSDDKLINISLTRRELTHIRVAMLHRLDKLHQSTKGDPETVKKSYDECLAMMEEGGVLYHAMRNMRDAL